MKSIIMQCTSLILFLLSSYALQAQQYDCSGGAGQTYLVTAESGLSLRESPNLKSIKIMAIPYGKTVTVCTEYSGASTTIEGVSGQWLQTFYRGQSGFMFSGFMEALPSIEVILPDEQFVEHYEINRSYQGLYLQDSDPVVDEQRFQLKRCLFNVDTVVVPGVPTYHYARLREGDHPTFLISGLESRSGTSIPGKSFEDKFLYPGESVSLTLNGAHFHVYAKGRILENKSGEDINPIAMIKNYELHVRRSTNEGDRTDQRLYQMDLPGWYADGYEGGIFLHWMGDLDGDGELDLLLSNSASPACKTISFFLSSRAERGHFFKQVAKYQDCDGC
ncbi:MAG: SH3 domain-containing protein [Bacteroidota bacterium]